MAFVVVVPRLPAAAARCHRPHLSGHPPTLYMSLTFEFIVEFARSLINSAATAFATPRILLPSVRVPSPIPRFRYPRWPATGALLFCRRHHLAFSICVCTAVNICIRFHPSPLKLAPTLIPHPNPLPSAAAARGFLTDHQVHAWSARFHCCAGYPPPFRLPLPFIPPSLASSPIAASAIDYRWPSECCAENINDSTTLPYYYSLLHKPP